MRRIPLLIAVSFGWLMVAAFGTGGRAQDGSAPSDLMRAANMSTVGIAAGRTEGAPLRFIAELARILDDGNNMRILPVVTRGPFENMHDLLFLRGIDMAVIYGDVLDHFKKHASSTY